MASELPAWLQAREPTQKSDQVSRFVTKNLANLAHVIAHFNTGDHVATRATSAWAELVSLFVMISIVLITQSAAVLALVLVVELIGLLRLPVKVLIGVLRGTFHTLLFGALIVLPSVWLNGWVAAFWWLIRFSLVMILVQAFRHRVSWRQLLQALHQLHVPSLMILTLDITVKYSHVLGSSLQSTLEAVWLRSVGRVRHPMRLASRLIGLLYLQSRHQATELYQAMWLRGFSARAVRTPTKFRSADVLLLLRNGLLLAVALILPRLS